jgi:amidase
MPPAPTANSPPATRAALCTASRSASRTPSSNPARAAPPELSGRKSAPPSTEDATLVARLRRAGAIPIARTNLPDLLFAFESANLIYGQTNNPYDVTCTSGGSSGGEAALIAACGSPLGLGSDAAGSVRLPAAFCGIAGIKPTSGRLPRTGHFPPAGGWLEMVWQIGPMARRVEDLIEAMRLLTGPDGIDPTVPDVPFREPEHVKPAHLRVAFYTDNGFAPADAECRIRSSTGSPHNCFHSPAR